MTNSAKLATPFSAGSYVYSLDDCSVSYSLTSPVDQVSDSSVRTVGNGQYAFFFSTNCDSDASAQRPNSARGKQFAALTSAVSKLCKLPEYDTLHVQKDVCLRVGELLGLLSAQTDVDPPKLFPQDDETLALTWTQGRFMRLLSVEEDEISLVDVDKRTQHRCSHDLSDSDNLAGLLPALGVLPKVSTAR